MEVNLLLEEVFVEKMEFLLVYILECIFLIFVILFISLFSFFDLRLLFFFFRNREFIEIFFFFGVFLIEGKFIDEVED